MSWYYAVGQEQRGPVEASEIQKLRTEGTIQDDSLVWKEGMANWVPFREANLGEAAGAGAGAGVPAGEQGDVATCAFSGKVMPRSQMIQYGDSYVAPEHKEAFVQRLKEGGPASVGALRYAGFWIRFAAKFIDGMLLSVITGAPYWIVYIKYIQYMSSDNPDPAKLQMYSVWILLTYLLMMVLQLAYATFMVGKFGATLGKMAVGVKVVNPDGTKVSYLKAFARWWAELVTGFTFGIGYIIVAFDDQKRALHDHICSTRVVKK